MEGKAAIVYRQPSTGGLFGCPARYQRFQPPSVYSIISMPPQISIPSLVSLLSIRCVPSVPSVPFKAIAACGSGCGRSAVPRKNTRPFLRSTQSISSTLRAALLNVEPRLVAKFLAARYPSPNNAIRMAGRGESSFALSRKEHKERREGKNRRGCLIFILFLCVLCVLCGDSISTFLVRGCRVDHRFITGSI